MTDRATPTLADVITQAIEGRLAGVHVALPARVESYDAIHRTCSAKPLVKFRYEGEDGVERAESLPVVPRAPLVWPGGFKPTVHVGDTVLLVFASSSLDHWLANSGLEVDPADTRAHNLTDAVAFLMSRADPTVLVEVTDTAVNVGSTVGTVPTLLGPTYRSAEDILLTAIGTFATAVGTALGGTVATAAATLNTAITVFQAAAATYLTQVAKVI